MNLTAKLLLILIILYSVACTTRGKLEREELSQLYSGARNNSLPEVSVSAISDQKIKVGFRIRSNAFLAEQSPDDSLKYLRLLVRPAFYESYASLKQADSLTVLVVQAEGDSAEWLAGAYTQNLEKGSYGLGDLLFLDLNRNETTRFQFSADRRTEPNRLEFCMYSLPDSALLYMPWSDKPGSFCLKSRDSSIQEINLRFFRHTFPLPQPPFVVGDEPAFSFGGIENKTLLRDELNHVSCVNEGIYHFMPDARSRNGFTFYRWPVGFPKLQTTGLLLEPLRYLLTEEEYRQLIFHPDSKAALDSFWLSTSGNREYAIALFKTFYSRIELSNTFFTSYVQGWQTDRGMIYTIFGAPKQVYRNQDQESWTYQDAGDRFPLVFRFRRLVNPLTDNDFSLERSETYRTSWYELIENWRTGKIIPDETIH